MLLAQIILAFWTVVPTNGKFRIMSGVLLSARDSPNNLILWVVRTNLPETHVPSETAQRTLAEVIPCSFGGMVGTTYKQMNETDNKNCELRSFLCSYCDIPFPRQPPTLSSSVGKIVLVDFVPQKLKIELYPKFGSESDTSLVVQIHPLPNL